MIMVIIMVITMNLIQLLKKKEVRLLFGARELKIVEKQLLGVSLTPSEKTRLSRDIRKKFEAVKMFIPFADKFDLKHGYLIKEMISEAKEAILASSYFPRIKKIVLFGSAVEHQLTLSSDIDLAVEFFQIGKNEAWRFRLDIARDVNERVQVQVYNILPDKIKKEIDLKGRILYERKNN